MRVFPLLMACLLAAPALGRDAAAQPVCGGIDDPCQVDGGRYYLAPPPGWDGTAPLPAAIFFHGWSSSGAAVMRNDGLRGRFADLGIALIVPDGRNNTWAHVGSPSSARDDVAFVDAVMADIESRWPIERGRTWVTGFSQGGSMAWDVACYRGDEYAAFAPVAGAFWEPLPETCPGGPVHLRHVHGLGDAVVPMAGRPIREVFRQGDVEQGMAIWRGVNGCAAAPDRTVSVGDQRCAVWSDCASGRELQLCLHDGGHVMPDGWVEDAWNWVRSVADPAG